MYHIPAFFMALFRFRVWDERWEISWTFIGFMIQPTRSTTNNVNKVVALVFAFHFMKNTNKKHFSITMFSFCIKHYANPQRQSIINIKRLYSTLNFERFCKWSWFLTFMSNLVHLFDSKDKVQPLHQLPWESHLTLMSLGGSRKSLEVLT